MGSLNKVLLIGNLGSDPELRFTPSGAAVCNFSLATNKRYTDRNGDKKEETQWHRIVLWQKLAETASQFLKKGSCVYIEGELQTRSWETDDGEKKYVTEVVGRNMQFMDRATGEGGVNGKGSSSPPPPNDDDLPF